MFRAYGSFPTAALQTSNATSSVSPAASTSSASSTSSSASIDAQQLIESLLPTTSNDILSHSENGTNTWVDDALPQLLTDFSQFFISNVNFNGTTSQLLDESINSEPYTQQNKSPASQFPIGSRRKLNEIDYYTPRRNGFRKNGEKVFNFSFSAITSCLFVHVVQRFV